LYARHVLCRCEVVAVVSHRGFTLAFPFTVVVDITTGIG
jgi:hypothetical protein